MLLCCHSRRYVLISVLEIGKTAETEIIVKYFDSSNTPERKFVNIFQSGIKFGGILSRRSHFLF